MADQSLPWFVIDFKISARINGLCWFVIDFMFLVVWDNGCSDSRNLEWPTNRGFGLLSVSNSAFFSSIFGVPAAPASGTPKINEIYVREIEI